MRKLALLALAAGIACTTATPPPAPPPAAPAATATTTTATPAADHGLTIEEEARILALEDRREYDAATVATWVAHPNALHRIRIALALGRIGPHAFVDPNNSGGLDEGERRAGVAELIALSRDSDRRVREMAAFALGEIADPSSLDTLYTLTSDADASIAAEAVEALSKFGGAATRYLALTEAPGEGVRARATRFLFRFEDEAALQAATRALSSASSAIRQEGAYALSRKAYAPARAQLELLITDPNVLTRAYAMAALGRIAEAPSTQVLMTALGDVHPWVRTNAAVALSRVFDKTPTAASSDHMPRVIAALEDPDPGVRAMTIDVLGVHAMRLPNAAQRLQLIVTNGTAVEREIATGVIAKRLGRQYLESHPYETSQWGLVRLLENYGADRFYRDKYANHESPLVRAAVLSAIPNEQVAAEIDTVRRGLTDADVVVRTIALDKFSSAWTTDVESQLTTLRQAEERERTSEMNDARLAAILGLAQLRADRTFLRGLLTDRDPVVRRIAAEQLVEKLKDPRPQYAPLAVTRTPAEYEEIVRWSRQPHTATIHMGRGRIELALLTAEAPMTTWNFAQLARRKFFDNTSFMRVVPNFVIQGGDPRNDMNGGPGYAIRDEINLQKYTRGAVGMALSGPDTGGSQFFIAHSPQPHLDGGYTIFARVYEGMSGVVDQTERGDRVNTITIDEHPPVTSAEINSISNVSLPLVVGSLTQDRIYSTVPTYQQRANEYQPDGTVVEMMKSYVQPGDRVEVYMGTWCADSEREVPKFLRIASDLQSQHGVDLPVRFVAVDRSKQQPAALIEGKHLTKVATFIYYRGDRELGRIEERPTALFEDDLLTIVASGQR